MVPTRYTIPLWMIDATRGGQINYAPRQLRGRKTAGGPLPCQKSNLAALSGMGLEQFSEFEIPPGGGSHLHAHTREAYAAIVSERYALKRELAQTRQSLNEVRDAMRALRVAVLARQQAEAEVRALYREREIARAKAMTHLPSNLVVVPSPTLICIGGVLFSPSKIISAVVIFVTDLVCASGVV